MRHEAAFTAATAAALLLLQRLSAKRILPAVGVTPWLAGVGALAWRWTVGASRRVAALTVRNRQRKRELLSQWAVVRDRIEIMAALVGTGPGAYEKLPHPVAVPIVSTAPQSFQQSPAPALPQQQQGTGGLDGQSSAAGQLRDDVAVTVTVPTVPKGTWRGEDDGHHGGGGWGRGSGGGGGGKDDVLLSPAELVRGGGAGGVSGSAV